MAKKVSKISMFDWKSFLWIIVVAILFLIWFTYPEIKAYWQQKQLERFQGVTNAQIIEIRDNKFLK